MGSDLKTIKVYEEDRNWLEKLKRKHSFSSITNVIKSIRKLIVEFKIEGDLKV